eukprot:TRINITY_DN26656_c0_g1_i1.p1 TRINITY_DN26656_c0_g1~~TRINITY_DN26656_c0_g1_i1.p1  ORF type:complete len:366 (-),score=63.82 TRINITY_DN26656_c0_g1_i1:18-1115(-)
MSLRIAVHGKTVTSFARAGQWQRSLWYIFEEMPSIDVQPNIVCFSSAITACARREKWQQALCVFNSMALQSVHPNTISCNATLDALAKGAQWKIALDLIFQGDHHKHYESKSLNSANFDVISYSSALSACAEAGRWQSAVAVLMFMLQQTSVKPNATTFAAALSTCKKGSRWEEALHLLELLPIAAVRPDAPIFNSCLSSLDEASKWRSALQVFQAMRDQKLDPSLLALASTSGAMETAMVARDPHGTEVYEQGWKNGKVSKLRHAHQSQSMLKVVAGDVDGSPGCDESLGGLLARDLLRILDVRQRSRALTFSDEAWCNQAREALLEEFLAASGNLPLHRHPTAHMLAVWVSTHLNHGKLHCKK